jgi:hypothetical protein
MREADHKIVIKLKGGKHAVPTSMPRKMLVGETVRYTSEDGKVAVVYPGKWPFKGSKETVTSSKKRTLVREGKFPFHCFLTLRSGKTIGWDKKGSPQSGADNRVGKGKK